MPFLKYDTKSLDVSLGIWRLEEDEMFFHTRLKLYEHEWQQLANIKHPQKRLEWLSSRLCMKEILKISHTDRIESLSANNGKPYLSNNSHFICYTHSQKYAAAIASPTWEVGVDLEYMMRRRNLNTRHLFMNEPELDFYESNASNELFLIIWSTKETIYKLYSHKGLSFKDEIWVSVDELESGMKGSITCMVKKPDFCREYKTYYELFPDFVLTYGFDIKETPALQPEHVISKINV